MAEQAQQIQRLQAVIADQAQQIQRLQATMEKLQHSAPAGLDDGFETWVRRLREKEKAAENARLRKQYYHIQRKKRKIRADLESYKMANSLY